jgi:hypothetical protein
MAGTGKSIIARTIARHCSNENLLGATYSFLQGGGEHKTACKLVTSIAMQLARRSPALKKHICTAIAASLDIGDKMLHDQWEQLVLGPVKELRASAALPLSLAAITSAVVDNDALDECCNRSVCYTP